VRTSFASKASAGGGTLLDNGCHLADLARFLGGDVAEVYCRIANRKFAVEVEDTAQASLRFRSGALGSLEVAWTATGWEEGFWVYGTEGSLEYTNRDGEPELRHRLRSSPHTTWDQPDLFRYAFNGAKPHHRHVRAFVEAVRGVEPIHCTGTDGMEAVRLILAMYRSAERNAPVDLTRVEEVPVAAD
jgi:predicted dehydrogenase